MPGLVAMAAMASKARGPFGDLHGSLLREPLGHHGVHVGLERDTEVHPEAAERCGRRGVMARSERAQPAGHLGQRPALPGDRAKVGLLGAPDVAQRRGLLRLPLAEPDQRAADEQRGLGTDADGGMCVAEQQVASEQRLAGAGPRVDRPDPVPQRRLVHVVVVDEARQVQQLRGGRADDGHDGGERFAGDGVVGAQR